MKPWYLVFILFCAGASSSCNKLTQSPEQPNGKVLPGVWELRAEYGSQKPYDPNDYKPGNGSLWKFTQTEFARIYKDSVYRNGTYAIRLGAGTDLNTGRKIDQFVFNNEPAESFELSNDTLRLYYGFIPADGDIEMYVKIAESH